MCRTAPVWCEPGILSSVSSFKAAGRSTRDERVHDQEGGGLGPFSCLPAGPKSDLSPGFVDDHGHCVGEIEAAALRDHGYTDAAMLINTPQDLRRQPTAFRAKHEDIAGAIGDQVVPLGAFGGHCK